MNERRPGKIWALRAIYLLICLLILFVQLMPLDLTPARFPGPDLLTALTFAWAMRRPEYVPALLIAAILLLADFLLQRPPGLWALLVLLGAEWLKRRGRQFRENTFFTEWLAVATLLLVLFVLNRLILGVMIVPSGNLVMATTQFGLTVLLYPLLAAITYMIFGTRRKSRDDMEKSGRLR